MAKHKPVNQRNQTSVSTGVGGIIAFLCILLTVMSLCISFMESTVSSLSKDRELRETIEVYEDNFGHIEATMSRLERTIVAYDRTATFQIDYYPTFEKRLLDATNTTWTPTSTPTSTPTYTLTPTATDTPTATNTSTSTPTPTKTFTPTNTLTPTRTFTPTDTHTPTNTLTPSQTFTPSMTYTASPEYDPFYKTILVVNAPQSFVNVRLLPSINADVIGELENGERVVVEGLSPNGEWYRIIYDGEVGWVSAPLLIDPPATSVPTRRATSRPNNTISVSPASGTLYVNAPSGSVNIRSGPGTEYGILGQVSHRDEIVLNGVSGSWYRINYNGGNGWISRSLTSLSRPAAISTGGTGGQTATCECGYNAYNCTGANTPPGGAQACYEYCISIGRGDIHDLDRDNDGYACE